MRSSRTFLAVIVVVATFGPACSSTDSGRKDSGGGSGGSGGSGGTGGSGMPDAASSFMAIKPCDTAAAYMTATTVTFGGTGATAIAYSPRCIKVAKGASVEFMGNFMVHPLAPSKKRPATGTNPIKETTTGMTATFTFPDPGYYPFYCTQHGFLDDGSNMAGVVWVTP
jgi:plastocyanin